MNTTTTAHDANGFPIALPFPVSFSLEESDVWECSAPECADVDSQGDVDDNGHRYDGPHPHGEAGETRSASPLDFLPETCHCCLTGPAGPTQGDYVATSPRKAPIMTTKAQQTRDERDAAIFALRKIFPVGSTVSTLVTYVSASGIARDIVVLAPRTAVYPDLVVRGNGTDVEDVSWLVARALGWKLTTRVGGHGIRVTGTGMDMALHLVYSLAAVLYDGTEDAATYRDAGYALHKRSL